jgi:hypothetical protein
MIYYIITTALILLIAPAQIDINAYLNTKEVITGYTLVDIDTNQTHVRLTYNGQIPNLVNYTVVQEYQFVSPINIVSRENTFQWLECDIQYNCISHNLHIADTKQFYYISENRLCTTRLYPQTYTEWLIKNIEWYFRFVVFAIMMYLNIKFVQRCNGE